jgi:lipopolysaccharide/colanic/teichoic acid biosynthesis glycosyltransferase
MFKRIIDIVFSLAALILLSPLLIILAIVVALDSRGGIVYKQLRVGKEGEEFYLYKFRSMAVGSEKKGLLTVGNKDERITRVGYFLRKYKLDELLQLFNVLIGDMSLVGPRPEVKKYVKLYADEELQVLFVKPGITDYASIEYFNENEMLAQSKYPERTYIEKIMPAKLQLNMKYIEDQSLLLDIKILLKTFKKIFVGS